MQQNSRSPFFRERCGSKPSLHIRSKIFLILLALVANAQEEGEVGDWCVTEDGDDGICRPLLQCPSLVSREYVYNGAGDRTPGLCSHGSQGTIVCCPTGVDTRGKLDEKPQPATPPKDDTVVITAADPNLRKSEQKCEEYKKAIDRKTCVLPPQPNPFIVGGYVASLGEYSHMAALGFTRAGKVSWLCGGSLISPNYVLTAAHCMNPDNGWLVVVRLGVLLIKTTQFARIDTSLVTRIGSSGDYAVEKVIKHPDYKFAAAYNDIALIRLLQPVTKFDNLVHPACLYSEPEVKGHSDASVAGWGFTEHGGDNIEERLLRQVELKLYDSNVCSKLYEAESTRSSFSRGVVDSMLCAGDLKGGKDTCQGDSGGPLQVQDSDHPCIYQIVGVTSLGKACGLRNSLGIYTRVSHFIPWIESVVWPK